MNVKQSETPYRIERHNNLSAEQVLEEMQEQALHFSLRSASAVPVGHLTLKMANLAHLLAPHGAAFVDNAFSAILHRQADQNTLTRYASELAIGVQSKIEILGRLRYSAEGRKIGIRIPGLFGRYALVRSFRLRGIGSIINLLFRVVRWPRLVRRSQVELLSQVAMLRGTTDGLQDAVSKLDGRLGRLQADVSFEPLNTRLMEIDNQLTVLAKASAIENWAEPLLTLAARLDEQTQRMRLLESHSGDILAVAAVLRGLRAEHGWPQEDASSFAARLVSASRDVVIRAAQAEEIARRNRTDLLDQSRRLGLLLSDVRGRLNQPFTSEDAARLEDADDHRLDALYVAFEDRFRGSRADIRDRQRAHLPLLRDVGAGSEGRPVVDLGTGRGEWLELLREAGLRATGVDLNRDMVELCKGFGLDCVEDDALAYLRRLSDNSLGAVTGFHIIEHLPFKTFVALLDESHRVLRPGGLILFETPNPANLLVGSRWFYLDPTHRNPMPAEMTSMIAEARGFVQVSIHELHPAGTRFRGRDEVLAAQLDQIFYGPQDYALVARKA